MKVYAGVKRYEAVCDLYPMMLEDGIVPDASMRGCLMNYAGKAKRQDLLDELYQESSAPADEMYYVSILRSCRQDRDVARALRTKKEMAERGLLDKNAWLTLQDGFPPSSVTYNFLIAKYVGDAAYPRAWQVIKT